jgi:excisionase family DNA binding protein
MCEFLTVKYVAKKLGVSFGSVRRAIDRGDLAAYRIGGQYRITPAAFEDMLKRTLVKNNMEDKQDANSHLS